MAEHLTGASSGSAQQRKGEYPPFKLKTLSDMRFDKRRWNAQQRKGEYPPFKLSMDTFVAN